jgi:endonuclease YncB( thermonuclease family)
VQKFNYHGLLARPTLREALYSYHSHGDHTPSLPSCRRIPAVRLAPMRGSRKPAIALAGAFTAFFGFGAVAQEQKPAACGGGAITRGTASRIIDGRTFVLDDGREVRLAAIEVPPAASASPEAAAAKNGLDALVGGDEVVVRQAEFPSDRYGRLFAYVYALRDGDELFAQGEMVSSGLARVGDHIGSQVCAAELRRRELAARDGKLGLWADSYYEVLQADDPLNLLAERGRFALVEGKVVSVRESGATIYVNFGRNWSEGFAVTIAKRNERRFMAAGLDLKGLVGRRVMVRGWVEQRSRGPWIAATDPQQIEPLDANDR